VVFRVGDSSFDYELLDAGERVVMLVYMQIRGRSTGIEVPFGYSDSSAASSASDWLMYRA
jgi:hypothetical protein